MAGVIEHDFTREKRELAKWRVVQAATDYAACHALPSRDPEKDTYVRLAREELFKRLAELEALRG
ncbi:hypothetical protein SAMN04488058_1324 [Deinococcus reticulitermitis]|uniref:Uncharacterized protein n=1 Tax=Deinococcus reticulitermitis TaxID=856736 RepID=A0A1H7CNP4_9DEIO|nr:hypothetical protein [Deinococcus reticulitermitis]SEJ90197.1 hypothetical protein SAMN04488058_1324 [Deinococcus reticulitermitis]